MSFLFFCVLHLFSSASFAQVEVAFIEITSADGKRLELEDGSQYAHIAISYKGQWLSTHPYRGVELVNQEKLEEFGPISAIVDIPDRPEPSDDFVRSILGSRYEMKFSWESEKYYCSKLVGKILDISPQPMNFNAAAWPASFQQYNGLPGLSPQGVFRVLLSRGYKVRYPANPLFYKCEMVLRH
jgi:hypothetical protein